MKPIYCGLCTYYVTGNGGGCDSHNYHSDCILEWGVLNNPANPSACPACTIEMYVDDSWVKPQFKIPQSTALLATTVEEAMDTVPLNSETNISLTSDEEMDVLDLSQSSPHPDKTHTNIPETVSRTAESSSQALESPQKLREPVPKNHGKKTWRPPMKKTSEPGRKGPVKTSAQKSPKMTAQTSRHEARQHICTCGQVFLSRATWSRHALRTRKGDNMLHELKPVDEDLPLALQADDPATQGSVQAPNEDGEWPVEKVIAKRIWDGKLQYQIRWLGFSPDDDTWEPLEHLRNTLEDVEAFEVQEYLRNSRI